MICACAPMGGFHEGAMIRTFTKRRLGFSQGLRLCKQKHVWAQSDTWNSTLKIPLKGHGLRHVRVDLSGSVAEMIIRDDHL